MHVAFSLFCREALGFQTGCLSTLCEDQNTHEHVSAISFKTEQRKFVHLLITEVLSRSRRSLWRTCCSSALMCRAALPLKVCAHLLSDEILCAIISLLSARGSDPTSISRYTPCIDESESQSRLLTPLFVLTNSLLSWYKRFRLVHSEGTFPATWRDLLLNGRSGWRLYWTLV